MLIRFVQSAARNISPKPVVAIRTMSTSRPYSPSPPVSPSKNTPKVPHHATGFLNFADSSPTPFHAVATAISKLESAGFKRVSERDDFTDASRFPLGSKCYYTRNTSSLVAFVLPKGEMKRGEEALAIVAGHTDSPCLKLRPISKKEKSGYKLVGVETYGGGIWATWVSRCHEEGSVRGT
jgi:aspartyl aminopeptidase